VERICGPASHERLGVGLRSRDKRGVRIQDGAAGEDRGPNGRRIQLHKYWVILGWSGAGLLQ
jgi:hypothetical protein